MIRGLDYSNIQIRIIAVDMSKTHFGGVFDGTIGSSPRLKGTHFNADLSIFSLQTLGYVMGIDRIERRREKACKS